MTSGAYHIPVLLEPTLELLVTDRDGVYLDGTLGGGGHSAAILNRLSPKGRVIGIDQDPEALAESRARLAGDGRFIAVQANFGDLGRVVESMELPPLTGVLLDLGVSSHQIDDGARGFSFQSDGLLDMRMDPSGPLSAEQIINQYEADELADVIYQYGEERRSRHLARSIVAARGEQPIETTGQLAAIVRRAAPKGPEGVKTLARVFQALRIEANGELDRLRDGLTAALDGLSLGGRLAVMSYHSLEDRIVKEKLRAEAASCICPPGMPICTCDHVARVQIVTRRPVVADEDEIRQNSRARSAKLRVGEKIAR